MTDQMRVRIIEHCARLHGLGALAVAANPRLRTPEGEPATWLDHCSMTERGIIEQAIADGLWSPEVAS